MFRKPYSSCCKFRCMFFLSLLWIVFLWSCSWLKFGYKVRPILDKSDFVSFFLIIHTHGELCVFFFFFSIKKNTCKFLQALFYNHFIFYGYISLKLRNRENFHILILPLDHVLEFHICILFQKTEYCLIKFLLF